MCKSSKVGRWFYRCADCLSVSATPERLPLTRTTKGTVTWGTCGTCGGDVEELGQVKGTSLIQPGERCPCDERCTSATGPNCNCVCGGENHGTNRIAVVDIVVGDHVPRVTPPEDGGKAAARAAEYRAAAAALVETVQRLRERKAGGWLDGSTYNLLRERAALLGKVRACRVHSSRMKMLAEYNAARGYANA